MAAQGILIDWMAAGLIDASGNPLASGKVYCYAAGTTTKKAIYTDVNKATASANPVVLDSLGQATIFADGSYKFIIKDSDDVTITTMDGVNYAQQANSLYATGTVGGTANAITLTNSPTLASLTSGDRFVFVATDSNTGSATVNVDGIGAKTVKTTDGQALVGYEIVATRVIDLIYDGTDMIIQNPRLNYLTTGLSTAGSAQSDATALTGRINIVETLADTEGVKLPAAATGKECTIVLRDDLAGDITVKVYPNTDDAIGEAAANDPILIDINDGGGTSSVTYMDQVTLDLVAVDGTTWQVIRVVGSVNGNTDSNGYGY